ncbi:hypothetical protein BJI46_02675 [Acinetobacter qingfengensis]|uniref:Uncharacterized protein n=1 Tax=Acinetobacter qingfengensis TaxID=1262585 RepID=A0A1E7R901_9GAMM|nr:hypothetical protein BJI46_02675 [Acinetobacter qingfengensis]
MLLCKGWLKTVLFLCQSLRYFAAWEEYSHKEESRADKHNKGLFLFRMNNYNLSSANHIFKETCEWAK